MVHDKGAGNEEVHRLAWGAFKAGTVDVARVIVRTTTHTDPVVVDETLEAEEIRIERVPVGRLLDKPARPRHEGDVLVVRTTHLKAGWIRRNGLPLSDRATMTERFIRHGDLLTHVMMLEDPVYLSEPLVKTNGFAVAPTGTMEPYPHK